MNDAAARVFLPVALLAVAILVWVGFQTTQLIREREALQTLRQTQETQVQSSQKVRASLDAIASGTAKLAEQGNPNAKLIVDELRKRDVTINPNPPAAPGK
jgi:hypothetical protein